MIPGLNPDHELAKLLHKKDLLWEAVQSKLDRDRDNKAEEARDTDLQSRV